MGWDRDVLCDRLVLCRVRFEGRERTWGIVTRLFCLFARGQEEKIGASTRPRNMATIMYVRNAGASLRSVLFVR